METVEVLALAKVTRNMFSLLMKKEEKEEKTGKGGAEAELPAWGYLSICIEPGRPAATKSLRGTSHEWREGASYCQHSLPRHPKVTLDLFCSLQLN